MYFAQLSTCKRNILSSNLKVQLRLLATCTPTTDSERAAAILKHLKCIQDPVVRNEVVSKCFRTLTPNETQAMFHGADKNQDGKLSLKEFQRILTKPPRTSSNSEAIAFKKLRTAPDKALTNAELRQLMLCMGLPYIGFGFVDNFLMLSAGDIIESSLGSVLHISTLTAAALGNTVSDVAGIGMGGLIQSLSTKLGFPPPSLTAKQQSCSSVRIASIVASVFGITMGCFLGMLPLIFI